MALAGVQEGLGEVHRASSACRAACVSSVLDRGDDGGVARCSGRDAPRACRRSPPATVRPARAGRRPPSGSRGAEAALERVVALEGLLQRARGVRRRRGTRPSRPRHRRPARPAGSSARTETPSRRTVHAPQTPCSQPTWVPVRPRRWRRKSVRRSRGSTSSTTLRPLTVTVISVMPRAPTHGAMPARRVSR